MSDPYYDLHLPELWWSPVHGIVFERREVWVYLLDNTVSLRHDGLPNERPADAVRLVAAPGDLGARRNRINLADRVLTALEHGDETWTEETGWFERNGPADPLYLEHLAEAVMAALEREA